MSYQVWWQNALYKGGDLLRQNLGPAIWEWPKDKESVLELEAP